MMTIAKVLEQAKTLTSQERKELVKLLIDTLDTDSIFPKSKNGAEIVDSHIEDPIVWVKAQRRKRLN